MWHVQQLATTPTTTLGVRRLTSFNPTSFTVSEFMNSAPRCPGVPLSRNSCRRAAGTPTYGSNRRLMTSAVSDGDALIFRAPRPDSGVMLRVRLPTLGSGVASAGPAGSSSCEVASGASVARVCNQVSKQATAAREARGAV